MWQHFTLLYKCYSLQAKHNERYLKIWICQFLCFDNMWCKGSLGWLIELNGSSTHWLHIWFSIDFQSQPLLFQGRDPPLHADNQKMRQSTDLSKIIEKKNPNRWMYKTTWKLLTIHAMTLISQVKVSRLSTKIKYLAQLIFYIFFQFIKNNPLQE